jgi:hypothetical protein
MTVVAHKKSGHHLMAASVRAVFLEQLLAIND